MEFLEFYWDPLKNKINQKKHDISFDEAKTVFYDPNARLIHDPDHSFGEDRFILLGLSLKLRILVVCHCFKESESSIRIIFARKATKHEQKYYKENLL